MSSPRQFISEGEVLAQAKNRHEETLLGLRLQALKQKEIVQEEFLSKQKEKLVEIKKKCLKNSGSSPDPEIYGDPIPQVRTDIYQKPWAYAFSENTHNALYREIAELPKKLPVHKNRAKTVCDRSTLRSAPARNIYQEGAEDIKRPETVWGDRLRLQSRNNNIVKKWAVRPQSGVVASKKSNDDSFVSGTQVRPQTCQNTDFIDRKTLIHDRPSTRTSRFSDRITKDSHGDKSPNDDSDLKTVTKTVGNSGSEKMYRYTYHHLPKEKSPYIWFRGRKLYNYVRPEERYKKDPLNLLKREKLFVKLSMTNSEMLEDSRISALKAGEAFPKAARLRALNELIEINSKAKKAGPFSDYNEILRAKIEEFFKSIEGLCPVASTYTKD